MDDREQMIRLINVESDTKISTSNDLAYFRITNLAQKILKLELYNVKVNIVLTIELQASNNHSLYETVKFTANYLKCVSS